MKCPFCSHLESKVVDSRPAEEGASIRRRRECLACHKRFTTYETMESLPLMVVKKDGSRQSFDRTKVMAGLIRACEKRPVAYSTLENMVNEIEQVLQNKMEREIRSAEIGELVMDRLKAVDEVAYVRFDRSEVLRRAFSGEPDIPRLLMALSTATGITITPGDTLLIFDEIQECPEALTALKYFCEDAPEYHLIAAGSLLGVESHAGTGFPVGKVDIHMLYPLSFGEFLRAYGTDNLADIIERQDWTMASIFTERLEELLRYYYYVGGMPAAVNAFIETHNPAEVRRIQTNLLRSYQQDFSKHCPAPLAAKLALLWDSVPEQLAKENKRFIYSAVQKNLRQKDLEDAMNGLQRAGLIYRTPRISKPALPLSAYRDGAVKIFFLDVGLLAAKAGLDAETILHGNRIFQEFKGALAEQYVQQELRAATETETCYWATADSRTEVDFVIQHRMSVIPVEVKAERNLKAKSLKAYCERYRPEIAVRCSMSEHHTQRVELPESAAGYTLIDLPLYAVGQLPAACRDGQG